ncbi:unnamed protein product [Psylliodes chrysocephalus]|uniref:Uncharacterized protein n=1 Tax=Psylliodes chrysocephalus TaxID=3402493 RepID=A0A9P0CHC3_9CUCU|nr:unnamed protein product [Psylliodes chrysocephala]
MDQDNKPKVDPGWNDPPMLNYNPSNPPPKSRIGNKRVAFPLNGTISPASATPELHPSAPPLPVPDFTNEHTKEHLEKLFSSDKSRKNFHQIWDSDLPDEFKKSLRLMAECLVKNNRLGAEIHKQELLTVHKKLCENWLKDVKF